MGSKLTIQLRHADFYAHQFEKISEVYETGHHSRALCFWDADWEQIVTAFSRLSITSDTSQLKLILRYSPSMIMRLKLSYQTQLIWLQKILEASQAMNEPYEILLSLKELALLYYKYGITEKGVEYRQHLMSHLQAIGDRDFLLLELPSYGQMFHELGKFEEAFHIYRTALSLSRQNNNPEVEVTVLEYLILYHMEQSSVAKAKLCAERILQLGQKYKNQKWIASAFSQKGLIKHGAQEYKEAQSFYEVASEMYKQLNFIDKLASIIESRGSIAEDLKEYETAFEYYSQALSLYQQLGDLNSAASTQISLGKLYLQLLLPDAAIQEYKMALKQFQSLENIPGILRGLEAIGEMYRQAEKYAEAISYFLQWISLAHQAGMPNDYWNVHHLADCYFQLQKYDDAFRYYTMAQAVARNTYAPGIITTFADMAEISLQQAQVEFGLDLLQQGLNEARKQEDEFYTSLIIYKIAQVYEQHGNLYEAIMYYEKALELAIMARDTSEVQFYQQKLGILHYENDDFSQSISYWKACLATIESPDRQAVCYNQIGHNYFALENFQMALDAYQDARTIYISLNIDDKVSEMNENIATVMDYLG